MNSVGGGSGPLVLDLRALQNPDHSERGIGRYALEFTMALCEAHPDLVGAVRLDPDLPVPDSVEPLRAAGKLDPAGRPETHTGRIHHVLSPFELDAPLELLWPPSGDPARLVVTLYDLIPEVYASHYLADPGLRRRYRSRLELVRAADRVLAISRATRDEAVTRLALDPARVVDVGAGISPRFARPPGTEHVRAVREQLPGLEERFILSVGGMEYRKNVEGLLTAYSLLPPGLRARYQLVVACRMTDAYRNHLEVAAGRLGIASRLYLPGYVSDPTLVALYQCSALFVFPSLYEGYGLPVAEAMACGAPVVSAGTSALAELTDPLGQFDPTDPQAIAGTMAAALSDPEVAAALARASDRPPPTWARTVESAVAVYEELLGRPAPRRRRLRVGFVTPLPPQRSGVAAYSYRLLEALRTHCDVDAFVDALEGGMASLPASPTAPAGVAVHPVEHLGRVEAARGGYDRMVYAVGNSEFHTGALGQALRRPGIVLAHEVRLPQLYAFAAHHGVVEGFGEAVRRMYSDESPGAFPPRIPVAEAAAVPFRMARELIGASEAFLTTSSFAAGLALDEARDEAGEAGRVHVGVLPFAHRVVPARREPDERTPLVATFGVVNRSKAVGTVLEAFADVVAKEPAARLAVVGPASPADLADLGGLARRLGIDEAVTFTGEVGDETWDRYLAEATVAVQLRSTTNGEYSAAVAECLSFGVPTLVTDLGAMQELPDAAIVKVPPGASPSDLAGEIVALLGDASRRKALGEVARTHASARSFAAVAGELYRVLASPR